MSYDFDDFLNSVKYLDKADILDTAYKKHKALDKNSPIINTQDRVSFQGQIQDLLYWIEKQKRPPGISDLNFKKFRPICENMVKRKELDPKALDIFG